MVRVPRDVGVRRHLNTVRPVASRELVAIDDEMVVTMFSSEGMAGYRARAGDVDRAVFVVVVVVREIWRAQTVAR